MSQKEDTEKSRSTRFLAIAYAGVGSSNEKVPTPFGAIYALKTHVIGYMLTRCGRGRFYLSKPRLACFAGSRGRLANTANIIMSGAMRMRDKVPPTTRTHVELQQVTFKKPYQCPRPGKPQHRFNVFKVYLLFIQAVSFDKGINTLAAGIFFVYCCKYCKKATNARLAARLRTSPRKKAAYL